MKVCFSFFFWALVISAIAQSSAKPKPMIFLAGGFQSSNQHVSGSEVRFDPVSGLKTSLGIEVPFTHRFTLSGSAGLEQFGSRNTGFSSLNERLNYVSLQVRATEYIPAGGSDFYVAVAPVFGLGIGGNRKTQNGQVVEDQLLQVEGYRKNDVGISGCIGFKLPFGTFIEAGGYAGFRQVYKEPSFGYRNNAVYLMAGHTLNWRKFKSAGRW